MESAIDRLPPEMLAGIFKAVHIYRPDHVKGGNLINAACVCRKWKAEALAILYRDIALHNTELGTFLDSFDHSIAFNNTRSLTVIFGEPGLPPFLWTDEFSLYTHQYDFERSKRPHGLGPDRLLHRLAEEFLPHAHTPLRCLSLRLHYCTVLSTSIVAVLRALPADCVDLELYANLLPCRGIGPSEKPIHVCEEVRALLPRMRCVRFDVAPLCESLLGAIEPGKGFQAVPLPARLNLLINCILLTETKPTCRWEGSTGPFLNEGLPSMSWDSVTAALRHAANLRLVEGEVVVMGAVGQPEEPLPGNGERYSTYHRCHASHNEMTTWAFPLSTIHSYNLGALPPEYIRTDQGGFVAIVLYNDLSEAAEGFVWKTLQTGSRLPGDRCKDLGPQRGYPWSRVWTEAEFEITHPLITCNLWLREGNAREELVAAEKNPGAELKLLAEKVLPRPPENEASAPESEVSSSEGQVSA